MEFEWLGHAGCKITTNGKVIYIDPYKGKIAGKADILLLTHAHKDHLVPKHVKALTADSTHILGPASVVREVGGETVRAGDEKLLDDVRIEVVDAYNIDKDFHPKGEGVGFIIEAEGKRIYHAGDTDVIPEMNMVEADIVLLPVGGTYTMDADEAVAAVKVLDPEVAIPIHWGDIVGHEEDARHFKDEVVKEGGVEVIIPEVEKTITL